jgi:lipopolysaccharide transport system ATP-binding protein
VAALLELGSGFNPEFSGEENVHLNASLLGMTKREINQRYDAIVRFADIGDFISEPVKSYSSGMLVRLAFSVAVHADADILIVDEALAVGDVFFQQKCYRKIREIMDRGTTFLFVSHDYIALQNLCDHGIILERGVKAYEGPAEQCAHRYMRQVYAPNPELATQDAPTVDLSVPKESTLRELTLTEVHFDGVRRADFLPSTKSRHGDKSLELIAASFTNRAGIPQQTIGRGDEGFLSLLIRVNRGIHNPEVAFRLIDRLGNTIFCTCNSSLQQPLGDFVQGDQFGVRFKVRLSVAPGPYTFTLELGKQAEDRPNIGIYFDVAEGVGPVQVFDPAPDEISPFYGMAQLPCEMEML